MTVFVVGITGTVQRIQIQAADETYTPRREGVSMYVSYVGLRDSV